MLDYERPEPPSKVQKMDIAMGAALSTVGSACLLVSAVWMWDFLVHWNIRDIITGGYVAGLWLLPIFGFYMLFVGWTILKRVKRD